MILNYYINILYYYMDLLRKFLIAFKVLILHEYTYYLKRAIIFILKMLQTNIYLTKYKTLSIAAGQSSCYACL